MGSTFYPSSLANYWPKMEQGYLSYLFLPSLDSDSPHATLDSCPQKRVRKGWYVPQRKMPTAFIFITWKSKQSQRLLFLWPTGEICIFPISRAYFPLLPLSSLTRARDYEVRECSLDYWFGYGCDLSCATISCPTLPGYGDNVPFFLTPPSCFNPGKEIPE